jgi:UDP-N-acetylmuramate dehydrogenase
MNLFADFEHIVRYDEPLAKHTWFRLGGPARYFIEPTNEDELLEAVKRCHENDVRILVLGRGSNLLAGDGPIDAAVFHLAHQHFSAVEVSGETVRAGGGADLRELIQLCARQGLSGVECLVGIPGSVGGAVKLNAGGRFGDIGSTIKKVRVMDSSGYIFERTQDDIFFGYRMTNIIAKFILEAELTLLPADPDGIGRTIKEVWMLKKNTQPMNSRNAGCIFKNPRAISAGALIDKVGLKGTHVGGAAVSEQHANFIIAENGVTAGDVLKLIDLIREKVRDRFDVELELEIDIWQ